MKAERCEVRGCTDWPCDATEEITLYVGEVDGPFTVSGLYACRACANWLARLFAAIRRERSVTAPTVPS